MNKLLLTFYGDDFTGSTDALEQLTLAGIRTALFIQPPTPHQLARFKNLQAVGVAGMTRSMTPDAMERELRPVLKKLRALGAQHVHYKVCSTFDSSPNIGSIGCVIDMASKIFPAPFVPMLIAAPALGRFTIFGNHFARYGIGSTGVIHRLDRHPSISEHPITPMNEADLRRHLAKQTKKKIELFDILKVVLPKNEARTALKNLLAEKPGVVLFDALYAEQLRHIGELIDSYASSKQPLFSVGSSGIEAALAAHWAKVGTLPCEVRSVQRANPAEQILVGSGSCSHVTAGQIGWALKHGFAEVPLNVIALANPKSRGAEIQTAVTRAVRLLNSRRSVIIHTTKNGSSKHLAAKLKTRIAEILGTALGKIMRIPTGQSDVRRLCIAGGDTSSYAARALGVEALEMIAPLTPGAPLCRAHAPGSPADGREVVFKGGQVGAENYFETVLKGNS